MHAMRALTVGGGNNNNNNDDDCGSDGTAAMVAGSDALARNTSTDGQKDPRVVSVFGVLPFWQPTACRTAGARCICPGSR